MRNALNKFKILLFLPPTPAFLKITEFTPISKGISYSTIPGKHVTLRRGGMVKKKRRKKKKERKRDCFEENIKIEMRVVFYLSSADLYYVLVKIFKLPL